MARSTKTTKTVVSQPAAAATQLHDLSTPEGRIAARQAGVPSAALKATVVDEPQTPAAEAYSAFLEAQQLMMEAFGISSPTRYVVSLVVGTIVSFGLGYLGGMLTTALAVAALIMSGSMFLYYAAFVVGVVITIWLSAKAGGKAFDYIAMKQIDAHAEIIGGYARGAWNWATSPFRSAPAAV